MLINRQIPPEIKPLGGFLFFIFFYIQLYYTTYNTAHAASGLWRYSSIYINPSQAA